MSLINNTNRDVFVGEIAKNLAKENEFTLFGFSYYDNNNIQFYLSIDETNTFFMQQDKITKRVICTPIETITQKSSSLSQDQLEYELKNILLQKYPKDFFSFLTDFNDLESNNLAHLILEKYLNAYINKIDNNLQKANYNLVNFAYYSRQLSQTSYFELLQKTHYVDMDKLQNINRLDFRHFAGIGYCLPNENIAYYCNAYLPNVIKKKNELESENYIVSPVFQKIYDLSDPENNSIKKVKQDFTRIFEQTISLNYLAVIQELKSLPPTTNNLFTTQLNKVKSNLTEDSLKAIHIYSNIWNTK